MTGIEQPGPTPPALGSWRGLMRNAGALGIGEVLARLLGVVAVVTMARRLTPEGFGIVTLGTTFVIWFSLVVDAGTEVLNVREIARRPDRLRELAEPVLGLRLALSGIAVGLLAAAAFVAARDPSDRLVLLLFACVLPALALNMRWMVLGVNGAKVVAVGNVASQMVVAVGVLLLVHTLHDTYRVPLVLAAGELCYASVVALGTARRSGLIRPRVDPEAWRSTLRAGMPLVVNSIARAAIYSFGIVAIALFLGREELGWYSAAYKPVTLFAVAIILFFMAFLASYSAAGAEEAHQLVRRAVRLVAITTIPLAAFLTFTAGFFVRLFYGDAYAPATIALAILIWSVPAMAIGGAYGSALIAGNRQGLLMRINVAVALLTIAASFAIVPFAGIEGAAAVTVGAHMLVLVLSRRSALRLDLAPRPSLLRRSRTVTAP